MARSQKHLIEAVGRFDAEHSQQDHAGGSIAATLSQVIDAHKRYQPGNKTSEFVLAERQQETIMFLLQHRHSTAIGKQAHKAPISCKIQACIPPPHQWQRSRTHASGV